MTGRVGHVLVTPQPLSLDRVLAAVTDPAAGGLAFFIGTVRNHDAGGDGTVDSLEYEAHPGAADELASVCEKAAELPDVIAVAVEHRTGLLTVGDLAVVVGVSAPHRAEAFAACRWLIDTLKTEVPIWKRQSFADGISGWVNAC